MSRVPRKTAGEDQEGEPTWDVAYLFPAQGTWSEDEYLALDGNHLVEFSHGFLEVLPMPTTSHQFVAAYLFGLVLTFVSSRDLGTVLFAPLRVRLWRGKFREPDIIVMLKEHADRVGEEFWRGADLVMEVVSEGDENRRRDLEKKRLDYARAKIPEYWIVDPKEEKITVLRLAGKQYIVHGVFPRGTTASSHLLQGFSVNVTEALSQQLPRTKKSKAKAKREDRP